MRGWRSSGGEGGVKGKVISLAVVVFISLMGLAHRPTTDVSCAHRPFRESVRECGKVNPIEINCPVGGFNQKLANL